MPVHDGDAGTLGGLSHPDRPSGSRRSPSGLLRDESQSVRIHREAANLLRRIDPPTRSRIINALSAESRQRIAHIVSQGSAIADHEVDALTRSLEIQLRRTMRMTRWAPSLDRLFRIAATTTHDEERGQALAVLMLTPQAPAVASAYATQLSEAWLNDEPTLIDDALGALSWLVQPEHAEELVELAFQAATDPITALTAVGGRRQRPGVPGDRRPHHGVDEPRSRPSSCAGRNRTRRASPAPTHTCWACGDRPQRLDGAGGAGRPARREPRVADVVPVVARPAEVGAS